ncbi:MAG: glycosyltransferase involved in cell wall biosynthesis [Zhongshania aliphaticivorans]
MGDEVKKPRLLIVAARSVMPVTGGREALLADFFNRIATYFELHLMYFPTNEIEHDDDYFSLGFSAVSRLASPSGAGILVNFLSAAGGTLQECLFYKSSEARRLGRYISENNIDIVYFDMVRLYRYMLFLRENNYPVKIIYDLDDLLSVRYKNFLHERSVDVELLGSYVEKFPFLNFAVKWARNKILKFESAAALRRELDVSRSADVVLTTSPAELIKYSDFTGRTKGLFTNFPRISCAVDESCGELDQKIVWLGNNNVPHNAMALAFLLDKVVPELPGFCVVVGGLVKGSVVSKYSGEENISFLGRVDLIDEVFTPGALLIAPYVYGTGVKIKLLEAMSKKVFVVTNHVGFQGIPYDSNMFFRPQLSVENIVKVVGRLSADGDFRAAWIAEQNKTLKHYFDKDNAKNIFDELGC